MSRGSNFIVRGGADFSAITRATTNTQRTLGNFQRNVSGIMKGLGLALGGLAIGKLVKDSLNAASELEGAFVGLESILNGQGKSFNKAKGFIDSYIADGLIPLTDAITAYKNLAARGYSDEQIQSTLERLKDAAAFGRQASYSLGGAVSSATEGLKNENSVLVDNAGVTKNVAKMWDDYAKSIGKNRNQLTQQEKIQAEVNGIMQETQFQVGDAAKYADTYAGRLAALTKTLKDIKVNLGQAFMPIANIVLPLLQTLANSLARVTSVFAQFSQTLFGKTKTQAKGTEQQANAVSNLGDATEETGKKASKSVAGFDEINSLGSDGGSGETGASSGIATEDLLPDVDEGGIIGETSTKIEEMASKVKTAFNSIRENIIANKEIIISALGGIAAGFLAFKTLSFLSVIPQVITAIGTALSILASPILVASAIIGGLVASFLYLYQTNEQFRNDINEVWADIANTLNSFVNDTLKPIFDYIVNEFLVPIGEAFKENILPVLADIFVGVGQILNDILNLIISTIDNIWGIVKPGLDLVKTIIIDVLEIIKSLWDKYGQDLINNVRNLIKGLQETFQLIWDNIINPIIKPALEMLTQLWTEHIKGLIEQVGEFVMKCINGALELYNGFIKPIIDWMIVAFGPAISNAVTFVVGVFVTMLAGISDTIKGLFKVLGGIVDFIVGVFTGNWKKAWKGIKTIVDTIFNSIFDTIESIVNKIIDTVTGMFDTITGIVTKVTDALGNIVDKVGSAFGGSKGTGGVAHLPEDHPDRPGSDAYKKANPDMPEWLGGGKKVSIPKLATGGITNGPMLAMIGDNPGGKEVVSPLDDLMGMIASAVGTAMMATSQFNTSNNSNSEDVILQLDGTTFARLINPYQAKEGQRIGNSLVIQTT